MATALEELVLEFRGLSDEDPDEDPLLTDDAPLDGSEEEDEEEMIDGGKKGGDWDEPDEE